MFRRLVEIYGQRSDEHSVSLVNHDGGAGLTIVICDHWAQGQQVNSTHNERELDDGMTFSDAEEWLMTLPEYAEVESERSLVERMRAVLTPEQLAELGL